MKSARITRLLFLSLALMLAMFLTACGPSNTVRLLSPAPAVNPVLPAPNAPRVSVVPFTDNRQDTTNLGVRRDGSAFVASDDLAQWVSRGLADELRRQGFATEQAYHDAFLTLPAQKTLADQVEPFRQRYAELLARLEEIDAEVEAEA